MDDVSAVDRDGAASADVLVVAPELLTAWLGQLCAMVPRLRCAAVLLEGQGRAAAVWPPAKDASAAVAAGPVAPDALLAAARLALSQDAPLFSGGDDGDGNALVARPLTIDGRRIGAVAIALPAGAGQRAVLLQLLAWGESWLGLLAASAHAAAPGADAGGLADLVAGLPVAEDLAAFGIALTSRLARRLDCTRVWLAIGSADDLRVVAVSHQSRIDARINLVGMVEEAMLEALAAGRPLQTGAAGKAGEVGKVGKVESDANVAALTMLQREVRAGRILSLPIADGDAAAGALLLERAAPGPLSATERVLLDQLLCHVSALIRLHRALAPGPLARLERRAAALVASLLGPRLTTPKLVASGLALVLLVLFLGSGEHQVRSDASIEGLSQQAIAAPFDGFVSASMARAGQTVAAGQVVATLDAEDLTLELQRVAGERDALEREYRQALAAVDQARTRIVQARIDQVAARQALLQSRLAQVELAAPLDGVIISGDLSRAIGTPVTKGDLLFEIAPLDAYRIVVFVSERDIDEIRVGQVGALVLSAHPDREIPLTVERISSVFDDGTRDGVVFRVEAALGGESGLLRPGMEGVARIATGQRSLAWIYGHEIADWLRLLFWRWLP
ncbi:MAG TPA: HlyD family efflux transporter periplasmic adaptor subunit [Pseudomonadales bacterium]|nr:HlyD family efflux transporter periplasmic adaptor subunit [Pseudomonadales bacterium]